MTSSLIFKFTALFMRVIRWGMAMVQHQRQAGVLALGLASVVIGPILAFVGIFVFLPITALLACVQNAVPTAISCVIMGCVHALMHPPAKYFVNVHVIRFTLLSFRVLYSIVLFVMSSAYYKQFVALWRNSVAVPTEADLKSDRLMNREQAYYTDSSYGGASSTAPASGLGPVANTVFATLDNVFASINRATVNLERQAERWDPAGVVAKIQTTGGKTVDAEASRPVHTGPVPLEYTHQITEWNIDPDYSASTPLSAMHGSGAGPSHDMSYAEVVKTGSSKPQALSRRSIRTERDMLFSPTAKNSGRSTPMSRNQSGWRRARAT
jgi:hypothetical protein